ncbi:hypothetical protein [Nocardiopsis alba]|uniref:hypothetical protein n=1 Tax=Nocardiopsis alba TaxID=53437 RepID=UPI003D74A274
MSNTTTTCEYGSWTSLSQTFTATVEDWIAQQLPDPTDVEEVDVPAIARTVRAEINWGLPEGVSLEGDVVYGPAEGEAFDAFTASDFRVALDEIDVATIIIRHTETTVTIAHIRGILDSPAQDPVLYVDHAGRLKIGPAAGANHHQVVLDREQVRDFFDGAALSEISAEDLEDLVTDAQSRVEEITAE